MVVIKVILLAMISGYLLACAALNLSIDSVPAGYVDKEIQPYLNTFKEYCKLYKADCSKLSKFGIKLGKIPFFMSEHTIGICTMADNQSILKKEFFDEATHIEREMLVFHETAHCVLGLDHISEGDHIMNPSMLHDPTYIMYYQELHNKLFNCSKNCPVVKWNRARYANRETNGVSQQ